jgi:hypothetical protein
MPARKSLNATVVQGAPVALTDAATIATDASLGVRFRVSLGADRTLGVPTNPFDGQLATWEALASGAQRILTLTTGSTGSFELTTGITAANTIASGKTLFVAAVYSLTRTRWSVLAITALT